MLIDLRLDELCRVAWTAASAVEREALYRAANVEGDASPLAIFFAIAHQAESLDPALATLLLDELEVRPSLRRMEIDDVLLCHAAAQALQLAMACELGRRIDRVIAAIGGIESEVITQEEIEAQAATFGVPWQVISYALTREREGLKG